MSPVQPFPTEAPNAPGAVASLVMGILALVTSIYGIVFAILAIVFGYKAKYAIQASGGRLGGRGLASAGRIMGWIWVGFAAVIIVAAVVFIGFLGNNDRPTGYPSLDETATIQPGQTYLRGFQVSADHATVSYSCTEVAGVQVTCGLYPVDDYYEPHLTGATALNETSGADVAASPTLEKGTFGLAIQCPAAGPSCRVHYTLSFAK